MLSHTETLRYTTGAKENMERLGISDGDVRGVIAAGDERHMAKDPQREGVVHVWRDDKHIVWIPQTQLVLRVTKRGQGHRQTGVQVQSTQQDNAANTLHTLPPRIHRRFEHELSEMEALLRGEVLQFPIASWYEATVKQQRMRSRLRRCDMTLEYRYQGGVLYMQASSQR